MNVSRRPIQILITEDDAIARRVLELFLAPYGQIHVAVDGDEAVKKFTAAHVAEAPYNLVCLDIKLPGKAGLEVLREMRELEADHGVTVPVEVIMLTGASDEKQIATARQLGVAGYLLKPVIESDLIALVDKLGFASVARGSD